MTRRIAIVAPLSIVSILTAAPAIAGSGETRDGSGSPEAPARSGGGSSFDPAKPAPGVATTTHPTAVEIATRWRDAVHAPAVAQARLATVTGTSDKDGVAADVEERLTSTAGGESQGSYASVIKRQFDETEVLIAPGTTQRRDRNGFIRDLDGTELERERTAIFETRALLFGPPPEVERAGIATSDDSKDYLLSITPPGGAPMTFAIDAKTWLPAWSIRPGDDDSTITTTYERWGSIGGITTALEARVAETDKPDYRWTRSGARLADSAPAGAFAALKPGPPDARLDPGAAPIPFRFESNHIVFKVSVNGREPAWFILDTGADENVIHAPRLKDYGLTVYARSAATGGGGTAEYDYARGATFTLPGVTVRDQHVAVIDQSGLERALGVALGGILGYDFISRFVMEVDYQKRLITLHDPKTWTYTGTGAVVPLTFDTGIPHMDGVITVGGRREGSASGGTPAGSGAPAPRDIPARFVLDFGAAETMTLTSPFVKANDLMTLAGTNTQVNGPALANQWFSQNNVRGRVDRLVVGGLVETSIPINLSVNTRGAYASPNFSGTVGESIYSRYRAFLDYQHQRAIFEPTAEAAKPFPERRTYGLTLLASGADLRTFTVAAVRPGSPAETDGFRKDDVVAAFDDRPATGFTLGELRDWLSLDGERHEIHLARGGEAVTVPVQIRLVSLDAK